jgi:hypothetical protein
MGGKNPFLGWAYIAAAALFVLLAIAGTAKHLLRPRRMGDMSSESRRAIGALNELLLMSDTTCVLDSVVLEPTQVELESDNPGRTSHPYRQVLCPNCFFLSFLSLL